MLTPCKSFPFNSYRDSLPELLDAIGASAVLAEQSLVLIKPNLVNMSPPPVTFAVAATRAIIEFCQQHTKAKIVVGDGSGEPDLTTWDVFKEQGYLDLAEETGVELLDLNETELVSLSNPGCVVFPELMIPKIVMEGFVISAATLKAHSLAKVTLSMKNMIGVAPPNYYQQGGYWRKSAFHKQMQSSIFELNCYRKPDLAIIDGSIGLADHHLGGPKCEPPVKQLIAGFDPVAVDAKGAGLLGIPWQHVGHIKMADGVLGSAKPG